MGEGSVNIRLQKEGKVLAFPHGSSRSNNKDTVLQGLVVQYSSVMSFSAHPPFPLV